jgi:phospholipid-binding lipoprotein MlaA
MRPQFSKTLPVFASLTFLVAAALFLASCTGANNTRPELDVYDPLEPGNRAMLQFNEGVDKVVLEPVAKGYRAVTLPSWRKAVRNFLRNLESPVIIGNQLLQGDLDGAGNATARVIINTLAGFGGILDLAAEGGIPHEEEDFGQTMAVWGVDDGPYVILPLLGPATLRDATGTLVDSYADPLRIYLFNIDEEHLHYTRVASDVVSQREELIEVIDDLRRNSFDYYAAVRSAYYQRRQALINDDNANDVEIPEYADF